MNERIQALEDKYVYQERARLATKAIVDSILLITKALNEEVRRNHYLSQQIKNLAENEEKILCWYGITVAFFIQCLRTLVLIAITVIKWQNSSSLTFGLSLVLSIIGCINVKLQYDRYYKYYPKDKKAEMDSDEIRTAIFNFKNIEDTFTNLDKVLQQLKSIQQNLCKTK